MVLIPIGLEANLRSEISRYNRHGIAHMRAHGHSTSGHPSVEELLPWLSNQPSYAWVRGNVLDGCSPSVIVASENYKGSRPEYAIAVGRQKQLTGIRPLVFGIELLYK